ncbi:MAG: hypothetical protein IJ222_05375 [Bacteroidales bacterium]|nr:hypothetical protein [Bacteroidales bacterium]
MPGTQNTTIRTGDRITPDRIIQWFEEAFAACSTPDELKQEMRHFLEMDTCIWLCHYDEMSHKDDGRPDPDGNPVPKSEKDTLISAVVDFVFERLAAWPGWIEERPCGPTLYKEFQYFALELGYCPGMECRYATFSRHGIFYLYRSGEILYRFHYRRQREGYWEMTTCHRTAKVPDTAILADTLRTGHWRTSLVQP